MAIVKVGVIGPTDIQKLAEQVGRPQEFFRERAALIGRMLADLKYELWVNAEARGMPFIVAEAYRATGGKRLVVLTPQSDEPWPRVSAEELLSLAWKEVPRVDWFQANYGVVSLPDVCICTGRSPGTLSELAYIAWNVRFAVEHKLRHLVAVRELLRDSSLPFEVEEAVPTLLRYVEDVQALATLLPTLS